MLTPQRFRKSDLLWLFAYPLYHIIAVTRHEASHALLALIEGATIEEFVVLPSTVGGRFYWGYVVWSGSTDWVPTAAPYFCDLLVYLLFFIVCTRLPFKRHWVWINLVILGLVSPLVNSGYQYLLTFIRSGTDVAWLLYELSPLAVHAYFCVTLTLYMLGLLAILIFPSRILKGSMPKSSSDEQQSQPGPRDGER